MSQSEIMTNSNNFDTFAANTIVAFHIGRGGRFNNAGHLSYLGEHKIGEYVSDLFVTFENARSVAKKIGDRENLSALFEEATCDNVKAYDFLLKIGLDLGEQVYTTCGGHEVGLTFEESRTGIGCINIDNDYDTTYCQTLADCNETELQLIYNEEKDRYYANDEMLSYLRYALDIEQEVEAE